MKLLIKKLYSNKKILKPVIFIIYLVAFILFARRLIIYDKGYNFPDEIAHISYVAYLEETNAIIPKFEDMKIIDLRKMEVDRYDTVKFSDTEINYLCHPPLYYNIVKLFNFVKVNDGVVSYNLVGLRQLARAIMYISLILAFYIGFTRIKKITTHMIYAFILISIPLFYITSTVCNDELSFLGVNIFVLGIIRFFEKKRNYLTYILIGLSIFICLLNKVTTSIAIIIASIIIVIYTIIKEKNLKFILCKQFLVTLPFYITPFVYYIIIIYRYGTVQPLLRTITPFEYFKTTSFYVVEFARREYTFIEYIRFFSKKFFSYWGGFKVYSYNNPYRTLVQSLPVVFILFFPIIDFLLSIKRKSKEEEIQYYSIYIGFIITVLMQFYKAYYEFQHITGYLLCNQSRYYTCLMVPFAMMFCNMIEKICEEIDKMRDYKIIKTMFMILVFAYVIDIYSVNLIN